MLSLVCSRSLAEIGRVALYLRHYLRSPSSLSPYGFVSEEGFRGITRFGFLHKLSLYADDLLLYISSPSSSLPIILRILEQFKKLSGYKLNLQKSEYFPVNTLAEKLPQALFPFKKVSEGFKYLGIHITKSFTELFAKNLSPLVEHFKADFLLNGTH